MKPKRVCHVVQTLYAMDSRIRKQVEALVEAGYEVDVVTLRDIVDKPASTPASVRFFHAPLAQRKGGAARYVFEYVAFFVWACSIMLRNLGRRYDVIHVSTMPDFLVFSALAPKLFGSRVLLDVHDPMPELLMSKRGLKKPNAFVGLLHWQERVCFRFADSLLTVSEAMKDRVRQAAPSKQISVVMNLPEQVVPREQTETTQADGSSFTIVYTGTLSPTYGLSMVVECVARLKARIPGIKLRLVGGGDDADLLRDLTDRLGLQESVEFLGWVPQVKLKDLIQSADVGISCLKKDVLTDLCFNTKAADYVGTGLPALVTRTSALERHFPPGVVRFFEAGDPESFEQAVLDLHEHPEMRAEMSRRGIEFSRTANWSTEKGKYVALIDSLCKPRGAESRTDASQ